MQELEPSCHSNGNALQAQAEPVGHCKVFLHRFLAAGSAEQLLTAFGICAERHIVRRHKLILPRTHFVPHKLLQLVFRHARCGDGLGGNRLIRQDERDAAGRQPVLLPECAYRLLPVFHAAAVCGGTVKRLHGRLRAGLADRDKHLLLLQRQNGCVHSHFSPL